MYQIFKFISENRTFLLFLLLEFVALIFIINTHSFHQSKFLSVSQTITGNIDNTSSGVRSYFHLKELNERLIQENIELRHNNLSLPNTSPDQLIDSTLLFNYVDASVINNTFLKRNNYIIINKGKKQGLKPEMGVITHKGIIGIIINVSDNFSMVMTLLNSKASFNAKLAKSEHFGSLKWDGVDFNFAQLHDIPLQANVTVGDTIVSGNQSLFFPKNIPIGVVDDLKVSNKLYEHIQIKLFTDYSALYHVYVVENHRKEELTKLENSLNE
jgi:rod shape-determining protein MreC